MRGASNMNIHYDVTGLLTAMWRSHSGQIVWAAWINCELAREEEGGRGFWTHSTYTGYPGSAGGRQLDRWRWQHATYSTYTLPNVINLRLNSGSICIDKLPLTSWYINHTAKVTLTHKKWTIYHLPSATAFVGQRPVDRFRRLYLPYMCACAEVSPNYIENTTSIYPVYF